MAVGSLADLVRAWDEFANTAPPDLSSERLGD